MGGEGGDGREKQAVINAMKKEAKRRGVRVTEEDKGREIIRMIVGKGGNARLGLFWDRVTGQYGRQLDFPNR